MTGIEHQQLKGITVKNLIVTIFSTISIVVSVMTTYFQLVRKIDESNARQETINRIVDMRLKIIEDHLNLLDQQVHELKQDKK